MRIAIMQPYLFPYLGYFQLMESADKFLLLDDVNFIKRGWINRNTILLNGHTHLFTLPLEKASQHKKINEIIVAPDLKWRNDFISTIYHAYHQSPRFPDVNELITDIINNNEKKLSIFLQYSLEKISTYIGINTVIIPVSDSHEDSVLKGQERILEICGREKADEYVNLLGGKKLYDQQTFSEKSVKLAFIEPILPGYDQRQQSAFLGGLSIIDVLMNNSREGVKEMVHQYGIVEG